MSAPSFKARGIVLRKTVLGEADLIITLITDKGVPLRAVAKSGRRPSARFAGRLELFNEVDLLCAPGKSLAIIQDARKEKALLSGQSEPERFSCASVVGEVLQRASHDDLEAPILFAAGRAALEQTARSPRDRLLGITAASILKTLAYIGLRPELNACVVCGAPIPLDESYEGTLGLSAPDGGAVCERCKREVPTRPASVHVANYARFFLMTPFAKIAEAQGDNEASFQVLEFCQELVREHLGSPLRSLEFLLTSGLDFSPSCKAGSLQLE